MTYFSSVSYKHFIYLFVKTWLQEYTMQYTYSINGIINSSSDHGVYKTHKILYIYNIPSKNDGQKLFLNIRTNNIMYKNMI